MTRDLVGYILRLEVASMKILITAFEPFHNETINPALEILKVLPDQILNQKIIKLEIPTVRYSSVEKIIHIIEKHHPDVIVSLGQAGGRADITFERIGINIDDYGIEDNAHNMPVDEKIVTDGPDAYFVNLPIKEMVHALREAGIAASVSNSAGTFVCNHVTYAIRHYNEVHQTGIRSGFIHVPYLEQQVRDKPMMPAMALDTMVHGIELAIETIIKKGNDYVS